jgi:hypothetical protein
LVSAVRAAAVALDALRLEPPQLLQLLAAHGGVVDLEHGIDVFIVGLEAVDADHACWPASMRACVLAAASSMRSFGMPASMAFAMPPSRLDLPIWPSALAARSAVRRST